MRRALPFLACGLVALLPLVLWGADGTTGETAATWTTGGGAVGIGAVLLLIERRLSSTTDRLIKHMDVEESVLKRIAKSLDQHDADRIREEARKEVYRERDTGPIDVGVPR